MKQDAVELLVWQMLAAKVADPVREYRFHPTRMWRFDLAWPADLVAVEVDGGGFVQTPDGQGGRHGRGAGLRADAEKYSEAACLGWRILRVVPDQVDSGQALGWIERALRWTP